MGKHKETIIYITLITLFAGLTKFVNIPYAEILLIGLLALIFLIIASLSTLIHELGHYIAAIAIGKRPHYFITGSSNRLFKKLNGLIKFKINGTNFVINPIATEGSVETFSYINHMNRNLTALVIFAGPLANILVFLLLIVFCREQLTDLYQIGYIETILLFTVWVNLMNGVLNLLPIKELDGWFIVQLYKEPHNRHEQFSDYAIHKEHESKILDESSYNEMLAPFYDSYSQKYKDIQSEATHI